MNDKKKFAVKFCIVIILIFFLLLIMTILYYNNKIASITKEEQNLAIEVSSLNLAERLSQEEKYGVYVGSTGRFEKKNNERIKIIDVVYFFKDDKIKASVDVDNREVVSVTKIETGE